MIRQVIKNLLPEILVPLISIMIEVTTIPGDCSRKITRVNEVVEKAIHKACDEMRNTEENSSEDDDYDPAEDDNEDNTEDTNNSEVTDYSEEDISDMEMEEIRSDRSNYTSEAGQLRSGRTH